MPVIARRRFSANFGHSSAIVALLGMMQAGLFSGCMQDGDGEEAVDTLAHWMVEDASSKAFGHPFGTLDSVELAFHMDGDGAFEGNFVVNGPAGHSGLGPVFIANSCIACHVADGRGRPPIAGETPSQLLLRTSVPGDSGEAPADVEGFGTQLQTFAIFGEEPEVDVSVQWIDSSVMLGDGSVVMLRRPVWNIQGREREFPAIALISARLPPPVYGLGLLEQISADEVALQEDPDDQNQDGISGRRNWIRTADGSVVMGRFGWKANTPDLVTQAAAAYRNDMGITSFLFPSEPCEGYRESCAPHDAEVDSLTVESVAFYTRTLSVPARRNLEDARVKRGEQLFATMQCASCHLPSIGNGVAAYTDLLLHDMGDGLADGRPDFVANGREWRTSPLWGIGLVPVVLGEEAYLHDGRARSLAEAILWHGGEAETARENWRQASQTERDAVVAFLKSL